VSPAQPLQVAYSMCSQRARLKALLPAQDVLYGYYEYCFVPDAPFSILSRAGCYHNVLLGLPFPKWQVDQRNFANASIVDQALIDDLRAACSRSLPPARQLRPSAVSALEYPPARQLRPSAVSALLPSRPAAPPIRREYSRVPSRPPAPASWPRYG
jgi:hypothetical protein